LTKVISLVDAIDAIDADATLAALSPSAEFRAQGVAATMPTFAAALRSPADENGQPRLRIMLRAYERQSAQAKRWLIDEVSRIVHEEFPPEEKSAGAEVTGFFVLLTNLIESMLGDQWTTFFVCTLGIFAMLIVAFRSLRLALIALVPNMLPIYVVMGLMGWLGLRMNMGAAMIAAVSMGQTVDSSLHYIVCFQRARRAAGRLGRPHQRAANRRPVDDFLDDRPDRRLWRADHQRLRPHDLFRRPHEPRHARRPLRQPHRLAALALVDRERAAHRSP
jgi:hypothetical protein